MLNLTPILKQKQPTAIVEIGESKFGTEPDVVAVEHNNRRAYFDLETVDDGPLSTDTIGNSVRMHQHVRQIFGGIRSDRDLKVDTNASAREVVECQSVKIHPGDNDPEALEPFLRDSYLLHRVDEVMLKRGSEFTTFKPREIEPSDYNTVKIGSGTDIEFVDGTELRELESAPSGTSGGAAGPGPGGAAGGGPSGGGEDESVDVNLEPKKPTVSFEEDVAGLPEVKRTARMLLALFDPETRSEVERRYGEAFASRGSSMMLYGPPGCGKTLVSEAIAHEAMYNTSIEEDYGEVKFLEVRGSDVLSKYSGESEKRVRAVFEKAHGIAQEGFCVLFFDEVETLIPDRGDDSLQRHERSLTNAFLQEMNDVEDNLLVIGATNMPFTIDPAATRRFPVQQFIPQPDETVMAQVWEKHLDSVSAAGDIDYDRLGAASVGYTPAEVADRILGSEFQRELVRSVIEGDPIEPDTEYLLEKLEASEAKTVSQYVASVRNKTDDLEGYPEMRRYVESQAERLGIELGDEPSGLASLLGAGDGGTGASDAGDDGPGGSGDDGTGGSGDDGTDGSGDDGASDSGGDGTGGSGDDGTGGSGGGSGSGDASGGAVGDGV
ncbi:ATP-binding protein [Halorubellus litoreus]|uniref:ATP-binding protein n=1 Tax=Halorubellus litoreus TaxID=755308 RepID=A0ABD5VI23_9EURY